MRDSRWHGGVHCVRPPGRVAAVVLAVLLVTATARAATMAECEVGDVEARMTACAAIIADPASGAASRSRALVGRGLAVYQLTQDDRKALENFSEAARLDPTNEPAFVLKGKMLYYRDRLDEALEAFTTATKLDPKDPIAWNTLGKVYYQRKDYATALANFEKAIAVDHRHPNANLNRAMALYHLGRKGEALAGFRFALYLYDKRERQYGYAQEMIDKIENELANN